MTTSDLCYFPSSDTLAVLLNEGPNAVFLKSFNARFEKSVGVILNWEVAGVDGCERFIISRSILDGPFSTITGIAASRGKLAYSYTDDQVHSARGGSVRYRLDVMEKDGTTRMLAREDVKVPEARLSLYQNYPNPFNPGTRIVFELYRSERVWLEIYDVSGKLIRRLFSGEELGPGTSETFWNGMNENGQAVSSGVYYCTLRAGKETISRKIVLIH